MWPRQASRPYEEALEYDSVTGQIRLARFLLVSTESGERRVRTRQGYASTSSWGATAPKRRG